MIAAKRKKAKAKAKKTKVGLLNMIFYHYEHNASNTLLLSFAAFDRRKNRYCKRFRTRYKFVLKFPYYDERYPG